MPRYVVIRESIEAPPQKERIAGQGGNLELDYQLPVKHVLMTAFFAFFGEPLFWLALTVVVVILLLVPVRMVPRLLPLLLVPIPVGIVPAFRAARDEWEVFTSLVKQSRWAQEVALNRDLDGDGHIGRPQIMINGAPRKLTKAEQDKAALEEFRTWVLSLELVGTAFRDHESLGRDEYFRRRQKLMDAGWAAWKNPAVHTLGWGLTTDATTVAANVE